MKKVFIKSISIMLAVILLAVSLSACSGGNKVIDFIYPFSADVNSFDPQVAGTADEYLIVENTFEGLIRMDDEGNIQKGVADNWSISDDKLTYTFHLKQGLKWNINTEKYQEGEKKGEFKDERLRMLGYEFNPDITAHDFVFALQRAASPETQCPLFSAISSIKNAGAVYSGKMKPSALGVKATDDYTLVITLAHPDSAMMETLTSAAAMPCNKEFFTATKGRYGLLTKYTLFNGQFYLSQILETSYLLKKNELYLGAFPAKAGELTLKIADEDDKTVDKLLSGYYDAAFIKGSLSDKILQNDALTTRPYSNTTWALQFNTNGLLFTDKAMRRAFCLGLYKPEAFSETYLENAKAMTPASCKIGANSALKAMGSTIKAQNRKKSVELWEKGLSKIEGTEFSVMILTVPEMESALKEILQGVESGIFTVLRNADGDKINYNIKIKTVTEAEMSTAIAKGEYDIALRPYRATSNSAVSFLRYVTQNSSGYNKKKAETALRRSEKAAALAEKAKGVRAAEEAVISSYALYPVIYETGYYTQAKGVSGVQFHMGTGRVSFVGADRSK